MPKRKFIFFSKKIIDFKDYTPNDSKKFIMVLLSLLGEENILSSNKGQYFYNEEKIVNCQNCKRHSKNI